MKVSTTTAELGTATKNDPRWASIGARDAKADGKFFYSVKTMGVYCRPCCAARLARPENVRFHATTKDAEQAGFRPCRRCKPDQPTIHFATKESSVGSILVAKSGRGVCAILMGDDPGQLVDDLSDRFPSTNLIAILVDRKVDGNGAGNLDEGGDFEALVSKVESFVEAPAVGL